MSSGIRGCGPDTDFKYKEVNRYKSPDLAVEAVIIAGKGGATIDDSLAVYVVPAGAQVSHGSSDKPVFIAMHVKEFKIVWRKPQFLEIQYEQAKVVQFKNFWETSKLQNSPYVVEIRLAPTTGDFSLPFSDRHW